MYKFYYFASNKRINKSSFDDIIRKSYSQYIDIEYSSDFQGVILADENFFARLNSIFDILVSDLNINLIFLESYKLSNLAEKAIIKLLKDQMYGCFYLAEIILKFKLKKDDELANIFINELSLINKELIDTAKAYIRCNMNAKLAANSLYIHRNTFNYRLNKFIELTQLDIRNYNNSLLILIYDIL